MHVFWTIAGTTLGALLIGAGILHLIPKLGKPGRAVSDALCRAPLLDLVITYFTVAPMFVGAIMRGWKGLAAGAVGQVATLILWTILSELTHPEARKGPRIYKFNNALVGPLRNILAVYITAIVTPLFWFTRMAEIALYPALTALVGLPPYKSGDWVNVSRHKFTGLVGHDLIWCLYCDWMTGVWSLGSEMLRNVESFWCPIRFASDKKCANCRTDFPDLDGGWVDATANLSDVTKTLETMYKRDEEYHPWFGHPVRITVKGQPVPERELASVAPGNGNGHSGSA
ncbi:MAG TPA: hypothetical protein VL282_14195 [Tepidisphaeraceae bacterium]|jgi:hypothetical protein|nr:hypothetical protein [Tepidisphaeraceae bacterium]